MKRFVVIVGLALLWLLGMVILLAFLGPALAQFGLDPYPDLERLSASELGQYRLWRAAQFPLGIVFGFHFLPLLLNPLVWFATLAWLVYAALRRRYRAVLLTLLHLGVKNIRIGPSLPAFVTPPVLGVLSEKFGLRPISTPEADLAAMLG